MALTRGRGGAARLDSLIHLLSRPAYLRSPGEAARGDQRPDRLLRQEPQERCIGWRRIVRSFSGADVRGSPR